MGNKRLHFGCSAGDCEKPHLAKGLCRLHYYRLKRTGILGLRPRLQIKFPPRKCSVENCNRIVHAKKFCVFHYGRNKRGVSFDRPFGIKGENNPGWKGGVAAYPNHYAMKKLRKQKIAETGGRCECCGKKPKDISKLQIHHKDGNKANHSPENLMLLYYKCHKSKFHTGTNAKKTTSKFIRLFGRTAKQIGLEYGISQEMVDRYYHKAGKKNLFAELKKLQERRDSLKRPKIYIKKGSIFSRLYGLNLRQICEKYGHSETYWYDLHCKGKLAEKLQTLSVVAEYHKEIIETAKQLETVNA